MNSFNRIPNNAPKVAFIGQFTGQLQKLKQHKNCDNCHLLPLSATFLSIPKNTIMVQNLLLYPHDTYLCN